MKLVFGTSRLFVGAALACTVALVAAGAVACGDDKKTTDVKTSVPVASAAATKASADTQSLRQVFLTAIEKWNAKDLDGFLALFTDKGFVSSFGQPGQSVADAKASFQGFFASQPLSGPKFSNEDISADAGHMDVVFQLGPSLLHSRFTLVKVGTAWKLDDEESNLPVDVPAGATTINVEMSDSAMTADLSGIASVKGAFAFAVKNTGTTVQDFGIATIPVDAVLADIVRQFSASSQGDVPGVDFVGGTDTKPGETSNLVFGAPLAPGRYVIIGIPHTEGSDSTPPSLDNRVKDFTIK